MRLVIVGRRTDSRRNSSVADGILETGWIISPRRDSGPRDVTSQKDLPSSVLQMGWHPFGETLASKLDLSLASKVRTNASASLASRVACFFRFAAVFHSNDSRAQA